MAFRPDFLEVGEAGIGEVVNKPKLARFAFLGDRGEEGIVPLGATAMLAFLAAIGR